MILRLLLRSLLLVLSPIGVQSLLLRFLRVLTLPSIPQVVSQSGQCRPPPHGDRLRDRPDQTTSDRSGQGEACIDREGHEIAGICGPLALSVDQKRLQGQGERRSTERCQAPHASGDEPRRRGRCLTRISAAEGTTARRARAN